VNRKTAALMLVVAASLALMSSLHLSGVLADGSEPFDASHAGVAEAIICLAVVAGATALLRGLAHARLIALVAVTFAIAGFVVGLSFTIRGGGAIDIAYHATVLPLLVLIAVALAAALRSKARPVSLPRVHPGGASRAPSSGAGGRAVRSDRQR
jgi:hypothetical protein